MLGINQLSGFGAGKQENLGVFYDSGNFATGNRNTTFLSISKTGVLGGDNNVTDWCDGSAGQDTFLSTNASGIVLKVDFLAGNEVALTHIVMPHNTPTGAGTWGLWDIAYSSDDVSYTNTNSSITWDLEGFNVNSGLAFGRYWKFTGISGGRSINPWIEELNFEGWLR